MMISPYGLREVLIYGVGVPLLGVGASGALVEWQGYPALWAICAPFVLVGMFTLYFFRDPSRTPPGDEFTVVSPADGVVTDVGEREEGEYLKGKVQSIGIFLSVFDVHVNRAPLAGEVEYLRHQDGAYHDARSEEASTLNEAQNIGVKSDLGPRFTLRQITGLVARRIVCPLKKGSAFQRGERIGMLKFGSRTELYLAPEFEVEWLVTVGDKVRGAKTAIARVRVVETATVAAQAAESAAGERD